MDYFTIILIVLIIVLLILIFFKLYKVKQPSPKCSEKIPQGATYKQDNKLPDGWDLTGDNTTFITPRQTSGVSI
jgi:hypothetical protein